MKICHSIHLFSRLSSLSKRCAFGLLNRTNVQAVHQHRDAVAHRNQFIARDRLPSDIGRFGPPGIEMTGLR
jgi:hypothetical protein